MQTKKGFTLIELLVVVLIIGILAAIALPMYTKTVEKSRALNALVWVKTVADSQQRYFLEHSDQLYFESDMADIEIMPDPKGFFCELGNFGAIPIQAEVPNCTSEKFGYVIAAVVGSDGTSYGISCVPTTRNDNNHETAAAMCKTLGYTDKKTYNEETLECVAVQSVSNDDDSCYLKP